MEKLYDTGRRLPEEGNNRILSVFSSLVGGTGVMEQGTQIDTRPSVADHTSNEAFEEYKKYNTQTNLRANERRMWGMTIEGIARSILTGITIAVGSTLLSMISGAGAGVTVAAGLGAIGVMTAISVGVFYGFQQSATREQSDKGMDVSDYHAKRSAGLIAQEIKKALQEEGKAQSTHTKEVIVVEHDAGPDTAHHEKPASQISGQELSLQSRLIDGLSGKASASANAAANDNRAQAAFSHAETHAERLENQTSSTETSRV